MRKGAGNTLDKDRWQITSWNKKQFNNYPLKKSTECM